MRAKVCALILVFVCAVTPLFAQSYLDQLHGNFLEIRDGLHGSLEFAVHYFVDEQTADNRNYLAHTKRRCANPIIPHG